MAAREGRVSSLCGVYPGSLPMSQRMVDFTLMHIHVVLIGPSGLFKRKPHEVAGGVIETKEDLEGSRVDLIKICCMYVWNSQRIKIGYVKSVPT